MRTEDLITAMAADTTPRPEAGRLVVRWFLPALAAMALAVLAVLGFRPDLVAALFAPVTAMKWLLPLIVALAGGAAALQLTRPGNAAGWVVWPVLLVAATVVFWFIVTLAGMPAGQWWPAMRGQTALFCLIAVPLIATLPLVSLIAALRAGASTAPVLSGALAGLAAGAGAAALYALHCVEDNPLFFLSWYTLGVLVVTGAGALAGARWLRW